MRDKTLAVAVFGVLMLAMASNAEVKKPGTCFNLPAGSLSDAYNLAVPNSRIDFSHSPWEADGNTLKNTGTFVYDGDTYPMYLKEYDLRYGGAKQFPEEVYQIPDVYGMHSTDNEASLRDIFRLNPSWLCANHAEYNGIPTSREIYDAHYTQLRGSGKRALDEATRLRGLESPPPPIPPGEEQKPPQPLPPEDLPPPCPEVKECCHNTIDENVFVVLKKAVDEWTYLGPGRKNQLKWVHDELVKHGIEWQAQCQ